MVMKTALLHLMFANIYYIDAFCLPLSTLMVFSQQSLTSYDQNTQHFITVGTFPPQNDFVQIVDGAHNYLLLFLYEPEL